MNGRRPPPDELKALLEDMVAHKAELDAHTRNLYSELRTGQYFVPFPVKGGSYIKTLTAFSCHAYPFPVPRDLTIDRLSIQVRTADTGKKVRFGIYKDDGNIYPGDLLLDAGEVDAGTLEVKAVIVDQALSKGLYWFALISDGTPALRITETAYAPMGISLDELAKIYTYWYKTLTFSPLPDHFPAGAGRYSISNFASNIVFARLKSLD